MITEPKIKILAVDDKPGNLIAFESVFYGDEYILVSANSGPEALEILEQQSDISVVLLDVQMPEMDGYETALRIKQIPGYKDLPIIFVTAIYREDPFIKRGYEAGAVDYFSKPFDPEILKMKVSIYSAFRQKAFLLREREQRLRETEELLEAGRKLTSILEKVPVGVLIADSQGGICQINEEVSRILKSEEATDNDAYGEILGWWDQQGKMLKDKDGPLFLALNQGLSTHNTKLIITGITGATKTILASASPLKALDGHIVGAVVVIQDFTESKKIKADLESKILRIIQLGVGLEEAVNSTNP